MSVTLIEVQNFLSRGAHAKHTFHRCFGRNIYYIQSENFKYLKSPLAGC